MRKPVKLRTLTTEEAVEISRLAASRTEPFRMVQRARLITAMMDDLNLYASEAGKQVGFRSPIMGVAWVVRRMLISGLPQTPIRRTPLRASFNSVIRSGRSSNKPPDPARTYIPSKGISHTMICWTPCSSP